MTATVQNIGMIVKLHPTRAPMRRAKERLNRAGESVRNPIMDAARRVDTEAGLMG